MTAFVINQPVRTRTSAIEVDAGLKPGSHLFRLVVLDNSGNASKPVQVVVTIREGAVTGPSTGPVVAPDRPVVQPRPTPVVQPAGPGPRRPVNRPR